MTSEPLISVRGEAVLEVDPEVALVHVQVTAQDKERTRALELLARRSEQVLVKIRSHGAAVEKIESDPARVTPVVKEAKARERIAGYAAYSGVTVTVADFSVLGDLVLGLASTEMVTVAGPWWQLRLSSPARREARLAAVTDAQLRARDYAEAFGSTVTGLVEVADQEMLTAPAERIGLMRAAARGSGFEGAPEPAEFDFEPAKQVVRAQVEARFTMTQPDFTSRRQAGRGE